MRPWALVVIVLAALGHGPAAAQYRIPPVFSRWDPQVAPRWTRQMQLAYVDLYRDTRWSYPDRHPFYYGWQQAVEQAGLLWVTQGKSPILLPVTSLTENRWDWDYILPIWGEDHSTLFVADIAAYPVVDREPIV